MVWLLSLLIIIHLFHLSRTNHSIDGADALFPPKPFDDRQQFIGRTARYPCLRQKACFNCYKQNDPDSVSKSLGIYTSDLQDNISNLSIYNSKFSSSCSSIEYHNKIFELKRRKISAEDGEESSVPTLTPLKEPYAKKPRNEKVGGIVGGVGAALVIIVILVLVYVCLMRVKKFISRASETTSTSPSPPAVDTERGNSSPFDCAVSPYDPQNFRQLSVLELEQATSNFSKNNIIGEGRFGMVYKGLLQDGSIVAIKRRIHSLTPHFLHEVKHIARVRHTHLVRLIGYGEDNCQQLLAYDYIPNGNVGNHLYDNEGLLAGKLDMRQRLSIALGAAKGLEYLHNLVPTFLHMHFQTSNVLVDESFVSKVSDYGLSRLTSESDLSGSSSSTDCFLDPELDLSIKFSDRSDVYSFGVFLLELISGREAHNRSNRLNSGENLVFKAKNSISFEEFVDKTLGDTSWSAARSMMELALICIDASSRRPSMRIVVEELERIQEGEIGHFHYGIEEDIGTVTLGSELFK